VSGGPSRWSERSRGKAVQPLCDELKRRGCAPRFEVQFPWLFLPAVQEAPAEERRVAEALLDHCADTIRGMREDIARGAAVVGRLRKALCDPAAVLSGLSPSLALDIWLPATNVAIEFDERQHFSEERGVSLDVYPDSTFPFDLKRWRADCTPTIYDTDGPGRDWQRAFRDAVRDLRCRAHGLRLVRLHYLDDPLGKVTPLLDL
jgi:hypothetical protein